jgi:hypothetical protein
MDKERQQSDDRRTTVDPNVNPAELRGEILAETPTF